MLASKSLAVTPASKSAAMALTTSPYFSTRPKTSDQQNGGLDLSPPPENTSSTTASQSSPMPKESEKATGKRKRPTLAVDDPPDRGTTAVVTPAGGNNISDFFKPRSPKRAATTANERGSTSPTRSTLSPRAPRSPVPSSITSFFKPKSPKPTKITTTTTSKSPPPTNQPTSVPSPRSADEAPLCALFKKRESNEIRESGATQSFGARTAEDFPNLRGKGIKPHTLILGTHPSERSLEEQQYYGHPLNAYWWIVGDCLGFRRGECVWPSNKRPLEFAGDIRYDNTHIISYEKQLETLCSKGFVMWDIIKSCQRPGSLDRDISNDKPNDIPAFCRRHPTVRRIVLTGGRSGCGFFKRHFKLWLDSGFVVPCPGHAVTESEFKRWVVPESAARNRVVVMAGIAVSPAAKRYTYREKRDFWEKHVFKPGLADFQASHGGTAKQEEEEKDR